jgi:hypothetical protein
MKHQADKRRSKHEFAVDVRVYLKVQPYAQSSVMPHANHKLSYKYFRPFEVLETIGTVAYRLKLPDSAAIQPMVHVSRIPIEADCQIQRLCKFSASFRFSRIFFTSEDSGLPYGLSRWRPSCTGVDSVD